jgi:U4/U6.U5 tri-snRNP-associated protein 3
MDPAMAAMMGFGGFTTTKVSRGSPQRLLRWDTADGLVQGKSVGPNADGGANVHKQRTWRQYMNRRGGFNRPLEKMK